MGLRDSEARGDLPQRWLGEVPVVMPRIEGMWSGKIHGGLVGSEVE